MPLIITLAQFLGLNSIGSTPIPQTKTIPQELSFPLSYQDKDYTVYWYQVNNINHLQLIPNFSSQQTSLNLATQNQCTFLINGGFYDKQNQPIGWFKVNDQQLSPPQKNTLFDGFFTISNTNKPHISFTTSLDTRIGLQTGPVMIINSTPTTLSIKNDEPKRRTTAAITQDDRLIFFTITEKDSDHTGPLLKDMPTIAQLVSQSLNLTFTEAINLDGGSASSFYTQEFHLKEANPIGSAFCLKE